MVARSFVAFDSDNLVVTSSSSAGLVGNGVINNSSTPNGTTFTYSAGSGQTITLEDTGGDPDVFEDDQSGTHVITDGAGLVANGQTVEAESLIEVRAQDINGNAIGPVITITVFSQGGVTGDVWGLSSDIPLVDGTSYIKTGGGNIGSSSYSSFVTCLVQGTAIATPQGRKKIETLRVGSLVQTRDCGPLPIRWTGQRSVPGSGKFAPVKITRGTLGNDADLLVSPEHRMVIDHPMVELLFGTPCVLVEAKYLVGMNGITQQDVGEVTYHHLLFDDHQIISGAGCWSESFFLATNALSGLDQDAWYEMQQLFPDMPAAQAHFGATAEMVLKRHEAALLMAVLRAPATGNITMAIAA